jgi:hypothetical protein
MKDGTMVTVTPVGSLAAGSGLGSSGGTVMLNQGDVLEAISTHNNTSLSFGVDISGTTVQATAPVQVISGHSCANIPTQSTGYCDHLEEAMFPKETLGFDYLVTFPAAPTGTSPHVIRIAATAPGTMVTFDPPISSPLTLDPGQAPAQIADVTQDVHIVATAPIIVAQYMQGSTSVPSARGDPSISLAIPTDQYRINYLFLAPATYDQNFVNIIAPATAVITLDGQPVTAQWTPIGTSGFSVARVQLSNAQSHTADGTEPFGIVTYGYGVDTSYMYPGGLDLQR